MSAKIRSITTVEHRATPIQRPDDPGRDLWQQASDKWQHLQAQVADLRWHQVPPEMLRDFLAAAQDIFDTELSSASTATEQIALAFLQSGQTQWGISLDWPQAGRHMKLYVTTQAAPPPSNPGMTIDAELDAAQDLEIAEARGGKALLEMVMAGKEDQSSQAVQLLERLPDALLLALVADIDACAKGDDLQTLVTAASLLRFWQRAENINSTESEAVLSGVTYDGKPMLAPEKAVLIRMQTDRPAPLPSVSPAAAVAVSIHAPGKPKGRP